MALMNVFKKIGFAAMFLATACCGADSKNANFEAASAASSADTSKKEFAEKIRNLKDKRILVFSKTAGWRHDSIEAGQEMFTRLSQEHSFELVISEDATLFTDKRLNDFDAIVFLNTTGDILDERQQRAMERFIQLGRGFVGIHAATDTESDGWYWYNKLVGAIFDGHPGDPSNVQRARMNVVDHQHISTQTLPEQFYFSDEWYDFKNFNQRVKPLVNIDRDSYVGAKSEGLEPISWFHEYDGGRSFYTNYGHMKSTFSDPFFLDQIKGGLSYAVGEGIRNDALEHRPDTDRFTATILTDPLKEPVSLDVLEDGSVLFVERGGSIKRWTEESGVQELGIVEGTFRPGESREFGLVGVAGYPVDGPLEGVFVMFNTKPGDVVLQRLSYIPVQDGILDQSNTLNYFEFPNEDTCCHTGGAVRFGPDGNLYIATGDNSNPFDLNGIAPLSHDEEIRDARRSSGNTKDFRGKILRIFPKLDGSYTIPEGNLFSEPEEGLPEIYVMGTRNPYTMGFDPKDGTLFFGDVGPDGGADDPNRGSRGYDEINRVEQAGNFGWPFFVGDNSPYKMIDPETGQAGKFYNPLKPQNDSPRNTGAEFLPPAQPAMIWYPYIPSEKFPEVGQGGRNALSGGVYRWSADTEGNGAWPAYFDGKLIISDFVRRKLNIVTMNAAGSAERIESVAENVELSSPLDLEFGPDGALYVLNYGSVWFSGSDDANIMKIEYLGNGNRSPQIEIAVKADAGGLPFIVEASSEGSFDPEGDDLKIEWAVAEVERGVEQGDLGELFSEVLAEGVTASLTLEDAGHYAIIAKVSDEDGGVSYAAKRVDAGNERPRVDIQFDGNQSFYWPERKGLEYAVIANDLEDGNSTEVAEMATGLSAQYRVFEPSKPVQEIVGHLEDAPVDTFSLLSENNCVTCHQVNEESVGPALMKIAEKYAPQKDSRSYLDSVLVKGGTGVWGEHQMPAHDYIDENIRSQMIDYILGLHDGSQSISPVGKLDLASLVKSPELLELKAAYVDLGTDDAPALENRSKILLQSNVVKLVDYAPQGIVDGVNRVWMENWVAALGIKAEGRFVPLGRFDLTDVTGFSILYHEGKEHLAGQAELQIRSEGPTGNIIAKGVVTTKSNPAGNWRDGTVSFEMLEPVQEARDLYLVVHAVDGGKSITVPMSSLTFNFD